MKGQAEVSGLCIILCDFITIAEWTITTITRK